MFSLWATLFVNMITFCGFVMGLETQEQRLLDHLFENYSRAVRPVINASDVTTVYMSLTVTKLDTLSLKEGQMITSGYIQYDWTDERLDWDPADYDGIEALVVSPLIVWLPDGVLYNRIRVSFEGLCKWVPGGQFQSHCTVDVRYFPFDKQRCSLRFGNWMYTSDKVNLTKLPTAENDLLSEYSENGEWSIVNTSIEYVNHYYNCTGCTTNPYPEVHFWLTFQRKSLYYIMNIVVPSVILSVLVLMVLWLPPDSGEKMSMGVTLLLSFTVFLLMVSENVPNTSEGVPVIVIYVITVMGGACLSVTSSVFVLLAHHSHLFVRPPFCLRRLAWKLNKIAMENVESIKARRTNRTHSHDEKQCTESKSRPTILKPTSYFRGLGTNIKEQKSLEYRILFILSSVLEEVKEMSERQQRSESRHERLLEWRAVAIAIDRMCFWIILTTLVLSAVCVLVLVPRLG